MESDFWLKEVADQEESAVPLPLTFVSGDDCRNVGRDAKAEILIQRRPLRVKARLTRHEGRFALTQMDFVGLKKDGTARGARAQRQDAVSDGARGGG